MRLFDTPYPNDHLFIRTAGDKRPVFLPLCEALATMSGVVFDPRQSTKEMIVLIERKENGKSYKTPTKDFVAQLQRDLYRDTKKISGFVIQPEGEMQTAEVTAFLEN